MFKKNLFIGGFLLILLALYSFKVKDNVRNTSSLAYSTGSEIASFELPDLNNELVTFDEILEGNKLVWVNFWASWCGPCRQEMPMMAKLYEEHHENGFNIVAIDVQEDKNTVQNYLDKYPVPFTVLMDSTGKLTNKFKVESLPTSFLVDSAGTVVETTVGFNQSWEYMVERRMEDLNE
ncbi:MAG: TlpA disulfide reductase family protein [Balneolaceae bacterium]|nr:TlpA disulfide reductase family protein [Balneolaceae bacterium]